MPSLKRLLDLVLALILALPSLSVTLVAAACILLIDRWSPFFVQTRLGLDEQPFRIVKLRTMRPSTQSVGTHDVSPSAVTPLGGVLRRTKIDELPQILNVLLGQMSFVGPRPGLPNQVELTAARRANGVFDVRPGITGLSQVAGVDMSEPERLAALDARYISEQSVLLDIRLILQTAIGRGMGDRVVLEKREPS